VKDSIQQLGSVIRNNPTQAEVSQPTAESRDADRQEEQQDVVISSSDSIQQQQEDKRAKHTRIAVFVLLVLACIGFLVPGVLFLASVPTSCKKQVAAASVAITVGTLLVSLTVWYGVAVAF